MILGEIQDGSEDPRKGPGRVKGPYDRSGTGRGTLCVVRPGRGTLHEGPTTRPVVWEGTPNYPRLPRASPEPSWTSPRVPRPVPDLREGPKPVLDLWEGPPTRPRLLGGSLTRPGSPGVSPDPSLTSPRVGGHTRRSGMGWEPSQRSGTCRGTSWRSGTGQGTLGVALDGSEDPPRGTLRVGGPSRRSRTGPEILPQVRDG